MEYVESGGTGMEPDAIDKVSYLPEEGINSFTSGHAPAVGYGGSWARKAFFCRLLSSLICVTSVCSVPYSGVLQR